MSTRAEDRPLAPQGEIDPDEHPDWRAAREYGIDVTMLEANLRMTVEQRIEHLEAMDRFFCEIHGRAWDAVGSAR